MEKATLTGGTELVAVKRIQKALVVQEGMQKFVKNEKEYLSELHSPFVMKLIATSRDDDCVYFVTEFLPGGDLFSAIENLGCLSDELVKFVGICTTLGLEHIHSHSIAYRDLKLENLVFDAKGYLKLVDFWDLQSALPHDRTPCVEARAIVHLRW